MLADKGLAALLTLSGQTVNATYFFNLQPLSFIAAESYCTDRGGHLVSWSRWGCQQLCSCSSNLLAAAAPPCHVGCAARGNCCINSVLMLAILPATCCSLAEQREVEDNYIKQGMLIASYHKIYWLGLTAEQWPVFAWADNVVPGGSAVRVPHPHARVWG